MPNVCILCLWPTRELFIKHDNTGQPARRLNPNLLLIAVPGRIVFYTTRQRVIFCTRKYLTPLIFVHIP
jgi:hypothetical protein